MKRTLVLLISGLMFAGLVANAQTQTWDPDGNDVNDGGAGIWNTTSNFWDVGSTTWVNGNNAIFGDAGANYTVRVADGGVTVGDLTYSGSNRLLFQSVTDNLGTIAIKSGGATWNTGGGEIEFHNIQTFDTALSISSGDTLTINGGGTFDAGEKANGANWTATGATLDVTGATTVRGNTSNIGQFGTVKLADGATFIQERNADQTMIASGNTWELNGNVTFGNRFNRKTYLAGVVSGTGRLIYKDGASHNTGFMRIDNAANTFSGGLTVDAENNDTMVFLNNANDGVLGAAPGSFDADNIILKNGGTLRSNQSLTTHANRGITLENGGKLNVSNNKTFTIGGAIAGNGGLQIGYAGGTGGDLVLNGANASYTGETWIYEGDVFLGATDALGQGVLKLGGEDTTRLYLSGQTQTIGGLYNNGSKTKQIQNASATTGTLIIDVADGETYSAGSATGVNAATDAGNFNLIKNGLGSQTLANLQIGGDVTVNAGTLQVGAANGTSAIGNASVTGGKLVIAESVTGTSYATSAGGTLQIGNTGTAGSINDVNVSNDGDVVINRSDAVTYSGVISGTGDFKATGGGTLALNAAQTYTGNTTFDNSVGTAGLANVLSSSSVLALGGSGSGTSAFDINGFDQEIGGLTFVAGSHTREVRNNGAADATLTLNVADGESYAWNANFAGSGTIDLVKTGAGTQTFGRNGTYTTALGDVTVNGGELVWNNNNGATVSGTVSVGAGGTLSGSGVLGGALTVAGDLNPGNSPGTLTLNNSLTLESTATLNLELTGTGAGEYDILLNDGGDTLTAGGTLAFDTTDYSATFGDTFTVFTNWGGFGGGFATISGTDLGGGLSLDTSNLLSTGTVTVIPEPATLGMIAIMGGGLLWIRRVFMV